MTGLSNYTLLDALENAIQEITYYWNCSNDQDNPKYKRRMLRWERQRAKFRHAIIAKASRYDAQESRCLECGEEIFDGTHVCNEHPESENKCPECGGWLQHVRPGKIQCENKNCPSNRTEDEK